MSSGNIQNSPKRLLGEIRETLRELLYPPRCVVCDAVLGGEDRRRGICMDCRGKLRYIREPRCLKCGGPLSDETEEYCRNCKERKHFYDRGFALYDYGSVRLSVYRFKYAGRKEYAAFFGREMAYGLQKDFFRYAVKRKPQVLIPVPLYAGKERSRGYNQAEALAEVIGRYCGIPVRTDLVRRIRKTRPMKELNAGQRRGNIKNAFLISQDVVKSKVVMLIDDIYTTGTTIDEIARGLRAYGVKQIYYAALSIGSGM